MNRSPLSVLGPSCLAPSAQLLALGLAPELNDYGTSGESHGAEEDKEETHGREVSEIGCARACGYAAADATRSRPDEVRQGEAQAYVGQDAGEAAGRGV